MLLDIVLQFAEKCLPGAAVVMGELAADQIERLNTVGALGEHRGVLGDVVVSAVDLLRQQGIGEIPIAAR